VGIPINRRRRKLVRRLLTLAGAPASSSVTYVQAKNMVKNVSAQRKFLDYPGKAITIPGFALKSPSTKCSAIYGFMTSATEADLYFNEYLNCAEDAWALKAWGKVPILG
jgi:hypothetical protein